MLSEGLYIRRNFGMEYEVGVAKGKKLWFVTFDLDSSRGTAVSIALAWKNALDVYVDGLLLKSDAAGHARTHTQPQFDPFKDTVVGGANDVPLATETHEGVIFSIKHWDRFHDEMQMRDLISKFAFPYIYLFPNF